MAVASVVTAAAAAADSTKNGKDLCFIRTKELRISGAFLFIVLGAKNKMISLD